MADYAFKLTAQQWNRDPYYVASSAPVHAVEVIAETKALALHEAEKTLGPPANGRYWRFWVKSMRDVRLADEDAIEAAVLKAIEASGERKRR